MGLLFAESSGGGEFRAKTEAKLLNELGCKACPLNRTPGKIDATGSPTPEIYVLGEAAGKQEEDERRQFVGKTGQLLRELLPKDSIPLIRWNNVLNCHPPGNRNPEHNEVECCRPRILGDIKKSKPLVIWGFGNVPLNWASGFSGIKSWRGRRMPVRIGDTTYWYYPFYHPSFLSRERRKDYRTGELLPSEEEHATVFDLDRAFADLDGLPEPVVHTTEMAKANVHCVTELSDIMAALQWASKLEHVGVDYETNCLRPYEGGSKILTASVGNLEKAYAFPISHPGSGFDKRKEEQVKELWQRFLLRAPVRKIVHNLAFELEWSGYFFGEETLRAQPWEDTANAAAIIDERRGKQKPGPFALEFLVQQYFGFNIKKVSNVDRKRLESAPVMQVLFYNGIDAKYHDGLWIKQCAEIGAQELTFPYELARRRVPTVVLSQLKGVPVDQANVEVLSKKYGSKVEKARSVIEGLRVVKDFGRKRGRPLNPQSNPELLQIFDEMLRCKEVNVVDKFTKESKRSVDETVLEEIKKNRADEPGEAYFLAQAIIDLREASGTKSKYIDALKAGYKDSVVFPDGLIHANFNTYFAETGRLSCDDPNLQNFPKRHAETKEVRRSIKAPPGCCILSADYGQIEARVIAMLSKDPVFCKALWERFDVHFDWAERIAYEYPARVGGKKYLKDKKVMKDFRTDIKNEWTFPLFFGAKDTSVAGYLKIPIEVLRPLIRQFWKTFSGVKDWQEELLTQYYKQGYTECLTGRRRHGPMSLNQVINSPVQGTAAEIVLDAMCRLSETGNPQLHPEINIHDDLTWIRVPINKVDVIAEKIIGMMVAVPFDWVNVPITIEVSTGPNWMELEEIGAFSSDTWGK